MHAEPLVTVLICTRDRQEEVTRCLRSVLKLDYGRFEIVVVDNASQQFEIPDLAFSRRTRFFRQPVPGLSRARNLAVRHAAGDIIALADDDATLDPALLRAAVAHFEDPSIGCVTGRVISPDTSTEWQRRMVATDWFANWTEPRIFERSSFDPVTDSAGVGTNLVVRKSHLEAAGFPELFGPGTPVGAADEHYLFHQIIQAGWRIRFEPEAIVCHGFPDSEQAFRKQIYRLSLSRGAYLAKFLFSEKGYRLRASRHLMTRLWTAGDGSPDLPRRERRRGFFIGPFALLRSVLEARELREQAASQWSFIKEYPGSE